MEATRVCNSLSLSIYIYAGVCVCVLWCICGFLGVATGKSSDKRPRPISPPSPSLARLGRAVGKKKSRADPPRSHASCGIHYSASWTHSECMPEATSSSLSPVMSVPRPAKPPPPGPSFGNPLPLEPFAPRTSENAACATARAHRSSAAPPTAGPRRRNISLARKRKRRFTS